MSAIGIGLGAAQGVLGMALQKGQDRRQMEQQRQLQNLQMHGAKEMSEFERQQQMKMWNDTNYGAQKKHMIDAGLNPGLMYGMSGGGGTTTGGGSGAMPASATAEAPSAGVGNLMGMAMMKTQMRVMESQAKKNEAEAEATSGVKTDEIKARTIDLLQGIENKKAIERLTNAQGNLLKLDEIERMATQEARLDFIEWTTKKAVAETEIALNEAYVSKEVREDKIKIIQQEAIGAVIKNALMEAQKDKTRNDITIDNAKIQQTAEQIAQGWSGLSQNDTKIAIDDFNSRVKANYPGIMDVIGRGVDDGIETIWNIFGKSRETLKGRK